VLLVQGHLFLRHRLARELVRLTLVLLLKFTEIRLQRLHSALRLDLLDEYRDKSSPDDEHQSNDGQRPGPAVRRIHSQSGEQVVERPHDP
jgi:hypothetical protein